MLIPKPSKSKVKGKSLFCLRDAFRKGDRDPPHGSEPVKEDKE